MRRDDELMKMKIKKDLSQCVESLELVSIEAQRLIRLFLGVERVDEKLNPTGCDIYEV